MIPGHTSSRYYTQGHYWKDRAESDSTYKVALTFSLLEASGITLSEAFRAAEVGCGQGAFLIPFAQTARRQGAIPTLIGLDISPQAIDLAIARATNIDFLVGSSADVPEDLDFIFCMDVLEHVERPYDFLKALAGKSRYIVIHLPIEHSIAHLLFRKPVSSYETFQHVHFYSWETAQLFLKELPFQLENHQFSAACLESVRVVPSIWRKAVGLSRLALYRLAPNTAAMLAGGSVLMLLKNDQTSRQESSFTDRIGPSMPDSLGLRIGAVRRQERRQGYETPSSAENLVHSERSS